MAILWLGLTLSTDLWSLPSRRPHILPQSSKMPGCWLQRAVGIEQVLTSSLVAFAKAKVNAVELLGHQPSWLWGTSLHGYWGM